MTSKTNLINQIENNDLTEAQTAAILDILNAGQAPKASFSVNINQAARQTSVSAIIDTAEFARIQVEAEILRAQNAN